jgi:outer membrane protein TolC
MNRICQPKTLLPVFLVYLFSPTFGGAEPLKVEDAIQRALERAPAVSISQKKLQGAKARELKSVSAFLPRLDFQESYLRTDQPVASFGSLLNQGRFTQEDFDLDRLNHPDSLDNFQTKFTVRQPLFMGGRLFNQYKTAQLEKEASEWDLEWARAEIGFRTVEGYWGLSLAQESEKVARMAVEAAEESLRQIDLLYKEGTVVRSDLLSATVRLANFQDGLVKARGKVRVAGRALSIVIGESADGMWEVVSLSAPAPEEIPELNPGNLLTIAKEQRPEYIALKARWDSAKATVRAAWGDFLPSLGLEASYEWNAPRFAQDMEGSYILGLGLQWNLFKGLDDYARFKEAKSNEEMVRYQLRSLEDQMTLEIEEATVAVTTGQESLRVTQKSVGQAEENLRIVRQRYRGGLTTVVELEQAELALSRSRLEWLKAIYELRIALATLRLVTGELIAHRR